MRHPAEFAVVFHHLPLNYHPLARPLARASECAAVQAQFIAFHDTVYAEQQLHGVVPILEFGVRSGVADTVAFRACVLSTTVVPAIDQHVAAAKRLGVPGRPGVIIDGVMPSGNLTLDELERALLKAEARH